MRVDDADEPWMVTDDPAIAVTAAPFEQRDMTAFSGRSVVSGRLSRIRHGSVLGRWGLGLLVGGTTARGAVGSGCRPYPPTPW